MRRKIKLKIGLLQYSPCWEDKMCSRKKIIHLLESLHQDLSLLVFPELTLTGFTMRSPRFSEEIDGQSVEFFSAIAKEKKCHVIAGLIERDGTDCYNSLVHLDSAGGVISKYRKIHPFIYSGENRHFISGEKPVISSIDKTRLGLSICYDLRFPELFRYYAKNNVDLIINIANWPVERIHHWFTLLQARAIENQTFVIGVNRVGKDKSNRYSGWSSVFHPFGENLLCLKEEETISLITLDLDEIIRVRTQYPFLNDIRLI